MCYLIYIDYYFILFFYINIILFSLDTALVPASSSNPCNPSPCGPNSRCLISHQEYAVCSCLPGYRGVPPMCQPECIVSTQCAPDKACINQKCSDPCVGTCGLNTRCVVVQHNPICSCEPGHVGDPFVSCRPPPLGMFFHWSFTRLTDTSV